MHYSWGEKDWSMITIPALRRATKISQNWGVGRVLSSTISRQPLGILGWFIAQSDLWIITKVLCGHWEELHPWLVSQNPQTARRAVPVSDVDADQNLEIASRLQNVWLQSSKISCQLYKERLESKRFWIEVPKVFFPSPNVPNRPKWRVGAVANATRTGKA